MLAMMELNIFEFSASKTEAYLASLNQLLIDQEKLQIRSFSDFKKLADNISNKYNETWLRTEYNLSVAVGQNSAAYARAIADQDIIPYVQYITVGDRRVRNEHELLHNRIFRLSDQEAMNLWPPNGYGCRCEMIQYPYTPKKEAITKGKQAVNMLGDKFKKSQFYINRGQIRKVFSNKQFYHNIKGLPENINFLNYKSFALKSIKELQKGKKALKLDSSITPDNVYELFRIDGKKGNSNFMGFKDYYKRSIILLEKNFKKHVSEEKYKRAKRHQLFPYIEDILKNPDEVWINDYAKDSFQLLYIKYYQDATIVVPARMKNGTELEIRTWYRLLLKQEKDVRKGYVIKKAGSGGKET